jgi:pSer/pThr/pTyr-binding forkhead associated (FHA) protein
MIIRLQHQRSDGDQDTYHLKSGRRYHVGRGSACEVRILDLKLSRKHCAIEYNEGEWRVIDLASTNGCKVDGDQIVGSVPLKVGTQIEIGQTVLRVVRILGDDEDDGDEAAAASPAAAKPAPKPAGTAKPQANPGAPRMLAQNGEDEDDEVEQEPHPEGDNAPLEHPASEWEPEPEPESHVKTGALLPIVSQPVADAKPDAALDASRKAAKQVAEQAQSHTGEIQKPAARELPAARPPADASSSQFRKTPVPKQSTPMPENAPDLDSGPFKSLDPQPPSKRGGQPSPPPPPPPLFELELGEQREPARSPAPIPSVPMPSPKPQPGSETRRRQQQKVAPVIVQPMSEDEVATAVPPPASPPASPPVRPAVSAPPAPVAEAPAGSAAGPSNDDRTFYITVLGRRVGPLTRAAARDLKARELKGTLTLKDLDQFA